MSQELINKAVQSSLKTDLPEFNVGDTVEVSVRIVEG
ncbi:MAG: 50S ribosomal protein L19, partial [Phycisphaerae bacterium]|nr:50S ribosomal protein L19 [Phycisphaerae bacterium]